MKTAPIRNMIFNSLLLAAPPTYKKVGQGHVTELVISVARRFRVVFVVEFVGSMLGGSRTVTLSGLKLPVAPFRHASKAAMTSLRRVKFMCCGMFKH